MKKWIPHIVMTLLICAGLVAQMTIRKVDTDFALYNTSIEKIHATIAAYDSASVVFKKTAGGQWEMFLYDSTGNCDFKVDSLGGVTIGDTLRTTYFKMTTGATNTYVLTTDANGIGTWAAGGGGWTDGGTMITLNTSTDSVTMSAIIVNKIHLDTYPNSDHDYSGFTFEDTAGANIAFPNVVYKDSVANARWELADADADTTAYRFLALATASISDGAAGVLLHWGFVRDDTWNWTPGKAIYLSTTAGSMSQTAPSGADDMVIVLGWAISPDVMIFCPGEESAIKITT